MRHLGWNKRAQLLFAKRVCLHTGKRFWDAGNPEGAVLVYSLCKLYFAPLLEKNRWTAKIRDAIVHLGICMEDLQRRPRAKRHVETINAMKVGRQQAQSTRASRHKQLTNGTATPIVSLSGQSRRCIENQSRASAFTGSTEAQNNDVPPLTDVPPRACMPRTG